MTIAPVFMYPPPQFSKPTHAPRLEAFTPLTIKGGFQEFGAREYREWILKSLSFLIIKLWKASYSNWWSFKRSQRQRFGKIFLYHFARFIWFIVLISILHDSLAQTANNLSQGMIRSTALFSWNDTVICQVFFSFTEKWNKIKCRNPMQVCKPWGVVFRV